MAALITDMSPEEKLDSVVQGHPKKYEEALVSAFFMPWWAVPSELRGKPITTEKVLEYRERKQNDLSKSRDREINTFFAQCIQVIQENPQKRYWLSADNNII